MTVDRDGNGIPVKYRAEIPVLMYHDIGPRTANPRFREFVVEGPLFAEHMAALRQEGFVTEAVSRLGEVERSTLPATPIFITFDDAYLNLIDNALPVLDELQMKATVFVPTAYIGGSAEWLDVIGEGDRRILDWSQLRELRAAGIEIGAHGHEHLQADLLPRERLISETHRSRTILEDGLGEEVISFAYPFGFHSRRVREEIRRCGYEVAFEVGDDLYTPSPARRYSIKRIQVGPDLEADELISVIRRGRSSPFVRSVRLRFGPALRLVQRQQRKWAAR